jgi:hypothetical protein
MPAAAGVWVLRLPAGPPAYLAEGPAGHAEQLILEAERIIEQAVQQGLLSVLHGDPADPHRRRQIAAPGDVRVQRIGAGQHGIL